MRAWVFRLKARGLQGKSLSSTSCSTSSCCDWMAQKLIGRVTPDQLLSHEGSDGLESEIASTSSPFTFNNEGSGPQRTCSLTGRAPRSPCFWGTRRIRNFTHSQTTAPSLERTAFSVSRTRVRDTRLRCQVAAVRASGTRLGHPSPPRRSIDSSLLPMSRSRGQPRRRPSPAA